DDQETWFSKMTELAESLGYAPKTKLYKKNPELYKGHIGDVSMVLRVAVTGRRNSPDLYEIMKILGKTKVIERLENAKKF
ncbi:MAG: glutamate--tRNA ligase, partial [Oscillospiraceae bacterium]|nr:glutamate--tRNA ligase [Oscillospiraceae bacterium]